MGFPKEILSDQGTQFNSDLMKQFHALCQCLGIRTSPYHPQANGTVERFHGTLKAMLKKVVRNHPSGWHRHLPALLFACREVPSESTGFRRFICCSAGKFVDLCSPQGYLDQQVSVGR